MGVQEVPRHLESAVGDAVEEGLSPVPSRVSTHGQPEVAGTPQGDRRENAEQEDADNANLGFAAIAGVDPGKQEGKNNRCGPKAKPIRQRIECITPKRIFFEEADHQEGKSPEEPPAKNRTAVKTDRTEIENVKASHHQQQNSNSQQAPQQLPTKHP